MAMMRAIETVRVLIPDLALRINQFEADPFEPDDELIAAFCGELTRLTTELNDGLKTSNHKMIYEAAHSIKGMGSAIGLPEISVLAQEVEQTLCAGEIERCSLLCKTLFDWSRDFIAAN